MELSELEYIVPLQVAQTTNHGRGKEHLCHKHRLRPERTDDDSDSSPFIIKKPKRQICSTDDCKTVSRGKHGLCAKHYHMKNNECLVSSRRKRKLDGQTTTVPPTAAQDYNYFVSTIDNQLEVLNEKQRQINFTQHRLNLRINALIEKKKGVIEISTPTESTNPSATSDTTNIDRIDNNSLMNNSITNNNHNGISLPPNSTTNIVIPPTFLLHTTQINNNDSIIRKANVNNNTEGEWDDTACLECHESYIHTDNIINPNPNPSATSDTTNIDRIDNNSLMNNSITNNNHNRISLPPNSTTDIVIPPTFPLHTPQINNNDSIIRKAEWDDTACLEC